MGAKENLLHKSMILFADIGYENVGIAQIVEEAGVTKPTLYHHFGNKEGLLKTIIESYGKELLDVIKKSSSYEGDVIGTLDRLTIAYMNYIVRYPIFFRLYKQLYQSPWQSDSYRLIRPFYNDVRLTVETLFKDVASYHTNLKGKEHWMSFSYLGLMDAYMLHHMMEGTIDVLDEDMCRQAAKQFLYGVFA